MLVLQQTIWDSYEKQNSFIFIEINSKSGLNSSAVAAGILSLELQNVIVSLPGKLYQLSWYFEATD